MMLVPPVCVNVADTAPASSSWVYAPRQHFVGGTQIAAAFKVYVPLEAV